MRITITDVHWADTWTFRNRSCSAVPQNKLFLSEESHLVGRRISPISKLKHGYSV